MKDAPELLKKLRVQSNELFELYVFDAEVVDEVGEDALGDTVVNKTLMPKSV